MYTFDEGQLGVTRGQEIFSWEAATRLFDPNNDGLATLTIGGICGFLWADPCKPQRMENGEWLCNRRTGYFTGYTDKSVCEGYVDLRVDYPYLRHIGQHVARFIDANLVLGEPFKRNVPINYKLVL